MSDEARVEELLGRLRAGDGSAQGELYSLVWRELHQLARVQMADQKAGHTLQATALVSEAFLKLRGAGGGEFQDRQHFLRVAAAAMRQILVDHARRRNAKKRRGDGVRVELDSLTDELERRSGGLLELDAALSRLKERDPVLVELVELRFFGGYDLCEAAALLGLSPRTAERRWKVARLILRDELAP